MKHVKFLAAAAAALISGTAFALGSSDLNKISSGIEDFADSLSVSIPQSATNQNVWAKAYIGNLFPAVKPHFGGGVNAGVTHLDMSGLSDAADYLHIDKIPSSLVFPTITADIRVGGVILPFDVGLYAMKLDSLSLDGMGVGIDYDFYTIGGDIRYAVLEGGLVLPVVSVGLGYSYSKGSFGASSKVASMDIDYDVSTLYLQAQVSKSFVGVLTPFAGLRGIVSKSSVDWSWNSKADEFLVLNGGTPLGKKGKVSSDGFDFGKMQPQVYGGICFSMLIVDFTASASFDLRNGISNDMWTGAFSLRLSL